jgi:predicted ATPase
MAELDFQPKMVGREDELNKLVSFMDKATQGQGNTVFISGEAGIGKTRLVNELKEIAQERGFKILSGNCMFESLTPFMPILEALKSGGLETLFAEEAPKVEAVYLITNSGILIKEVIREETELDPDIFVSMFTTVTDFLNESLSTLTGKEEKGTLNSLGYKNYRILIERLININVVVVLTGKENEFLLNDMKDILIKITKAFKTTLEEWGGDEEKVTGIEGVLDSLIKSGKYDGKYHGTDDPKIRRNLLFENVSLGLSRLAKISPMVLCIEDLQWVDPSSLAMMHYLARNTKESGLLLLGTYRPEDVAASNGKGHSYIETMQLMDREDLLEKMELPRLPEESIDEFLISMLQKIDLTDEFKKKIYKESEGNPLFVIEIIKFFIDENVINNPDGIWKVVKPLEDSTIPSKVLSVISRRIKRVEKEDRKVLDYASFIGEVFNSALLAAILDMNRVELLERLKNLERTHRLIHTQNGNFKFDHAKIKEVLYSEIPEELGKEYHQKIASTLETVNKNNLDEVIEDLAFHYYRCKNKKKALYYLSKALDKAKKVYSNEDMIRLYNNALDLEENDEKRVDLYVKLGCVYRLIGIYQKATECFRRALELVENKLKRTEIIVNISITQYLQGTYDEALGTCKGALDLVGESCSKEETMALIHMVRVYGKLGQHEKSIIYLEKALQILDNLHEDDLLVEALNYGGRVYLNKGEYDIALEYLNRSIEVTKKKGSLLPQGIALNDIGNIHRYKGQYDEALKSFKMFLRMSEKVGYQRGKAIASANIGQVYSDKEDYDNAIKNHRRNIMISKRIGDSEELAHTYSDMAYAYYYKKDLDTALSFCNLGLELGHKEAKMRRILGMIYREKKEWEKSIENFLQSANLSENSGDMLDFGEVYHEFGLMWAAKGDKKKAKDMLQRAIQTYKNIGLDYQADKVKRDMTGID